MPTLCSQSEELQCPLLSKDQISHRITHDSCLGYLSVAHIKILFQNLIDLPTLYIHAKMVL